MLRRVVIATVLAVPLAILGYELWSTSAEERAWRETFEARVAKHKAAGRPATYADLAALMEPLRDEDNGARPLMRIEQEYEDLLASLGYKKRPSLSYYLLKAGEPKPRAERVARLLVRDHAKQMATWWAQIEDVASRTYIQAPPGARLRLTGAAPASLDTASELFVVRAWSQPETTLASSLTLFQLASRTRHNGGFFYYRKRDVTEDALRLLRLALDGGQSPTRAQSEEFQRLLAGLERDALPDLGRVPDDMRAEWISVGDPDDDRWQWVSDYDHYGEGWKLYRDMIRAFDRMDEVEEELESVAGVRAIAQRGEDVPEWNDNLPSLGYLAKEALEMLTRLRLARLALAVRADFDAGDSPAAPGPELLSELPLEALTGERLVLHREDDQTFVGVPWREQGKPWLEDYDLGFEDEDEEALPTWAEDDLRDDGFIWRVPRTR